MVVFLGKEGVSLETESLELTFYLKALWREIPTKFNFQNKKSFLCLHVNLIMIVGRMTNL